MTMLQKNNVEFVKKYRDEGLNVIPCIEREKLPKINWKEYQDKKYEEVFPKNANVAVICGKISENLVVVDVDKNDLDLVNQIYPDALKETRVVQTGSGGYHLYFHVHELPKKPLRLNNPNGDHIDVQVDGTYVIAPPSIHPNGREYKIVSDVDKIKTINFQDVVVNLEKTGFKVDKKVSSVDLVKGGIKKGNRHNMALKYCAKLFLRDGFDVDLARREMSDWNKTNEPPIPQEELDKIIIDSTKYSQEKLKEVADSSNKPSEKEMQQKRELKKLWKKLKSTKVKSKKNEIKNQINAIEKDIDLEQTKWSDDEQEYSNMAEELYLFATRRIKKTVVSKEDGNQVYGLIKNNNHYETIEIPSSQAIHWLSKLFYDEYGTIATEESYKQALTQIKSQALYSETSRERVYNRIAQTDDAFYYDLASPKWEIVKIAKDNISIIETDENTPIFHRMQHQAQQAYPILDTSRDALSELCDFLHISDYYQILFKIQIISNFIEKPPTPIMVLIAEAGALKSTISSIVKTITDPSGIGRDSNVSSFPEKRDDLNIHVYNRFVSAFDNITNLKQVIADDLCRMVSGQQYSKRKLFKNTEEILMSYKRKLVLNSITLNIEQPDLVQRCIFYRLNEIKKTSRITEEDVEKKIEELLPHILGQIFQILQKSLTLYPEIHEEVKNPERMADFTIWGETFSRILGYKNNDFVKKYSDNLEQTYLDASYSHAIISYFEGIVNNEITLADNEEIRKDGKTFSVSMGNFYSGLKFYARQQGFDVHTKYSSFPKHPNKLGGYLRKIKPILVVNNFEIKILTDTSRASGYRNRKIVNIVKIDPKEKLVD